MKKLMIVAIIFIILLSSRNSQEFSLKDYFDGQYIAYTDKRVNDSSVNLGFCYMNTDTENINQLVGESMKIYNFEPASAIKTLRAKVIRTEYLDTGATVIYAYTDLIKPQVNIEKQNVNLQIAYYEEYSIIGWPLILGSF